MWATNQFTINLIFNDILLFAFGSKVLFWVVFEISAIEHHSFKRLPIFVIHMEIETWKRVICTKLLSHLTWRVGIRGSVEC